MLKLVIACVGCGEVVREIPIKSVHPDGIGVYGVEARRIENSIINGSCNQWQRIRTDASAPADTWACPRCWRIYEEIRVAKGGDRR